MRTIQTLFTISASAILRGLSQIYYKRSDNPKTEQSLTDTLP